MARIRRGGLRRRRKEQRSKSSSEQPATPSGDPAEPRDVEPPRAADGDEPRGRKASKADVERGAEASARRRGERRAARRGERREAHAERRGERREARQARRAKVAGRFGAGRAARSDLRRRRAPEEAQQEILDAAERVFIEFQPDQVGLKEVSREAGVSHSLITHYFGTYANMVEAVLERRVRALRGVILDKLRSEGALSRPGELLALLFSALQDPVHLRLTRWLLASERPSAAHAFALREQGLALIAQQVAQTIEPLPSRALVERVELALVCAVAAAYGFAIGKYALVGALGREASSELDALVQRTLGEMVHGYLRVPST